LGCVKSDGRTDCALAGAKMPKLSAPASANPESSRARLRVRDPLIVVIKGVPFSW